MRSRSSCESPLVGLTSMKKLFLMLFRNLLNACSLMCGPCSRYQAGWNSPPTQDLWSRDLLVPRWSSLSWPVGKDALAAFARWILPLPSDSRDDWLVAVLRQGFLPYWSICIAVTLSLSKLSPQAYTNTCTILVYPPCFSLVAVWLNFGNNSDHPERLNDDN